MGKTIYNRMDPDFYDEEPIDYEEMADKKASRNEELWRESKYGSKYETMETAL